MNFQVHRLHSKFLLKSLQTQFGIFAELGIIIFVMQLIHCENYIKMSLPPIRHFCNMVHYFDETHENN